MPSISCKLNVPSIHTILEKIHIFNKSMIKKIFIYLRIKFIQYKFACFTKKYFRQKLEFQKIYLLIYLIISLILGDVAKVRPR